MGPIIPSELSKIPVSQPLNSPDTSSRDTLSASDIVKIMMNKVSFKLLNTEGKESTVASSVSAAQLMGMALLSMADNAKKESALGIPPGSLTQKLEAEIHKELGKFSTENPYGNQRNQAISSANFIASNVPIRHEQFEQMLSECYQAEKLETYNELVADITESFIDKKTNGKIKRLFEGHTKARRNEITAAIGNVIEFRGVWEESFSSTETAPGEFLCANGDIINNVNMMCATDNFHYTSTIEFQAIAKEFRSVNGEGLKLVAIKPQKRSETAINNLDSEKINHLIGNLNEFKTKLELKLPKIEVVDSCDTDLLEKITLALGTSIKAEDLSRLGKLSRHELDMIQKIKASIDEKGARGAIATVATITERCFSLDSDDEEETDCFHFDCPGYIGIVDSKGNRLLELIIKDGRFLVLDGSPKITFAENRNSVNKQFAYEKDLTIQNVTSQKRLKNYPCHPLQPSKITKMMTEETEVLPVKNKQLQKDVKTSTGEPTASTVDQFSKHLSANPRKNVDVSTLIQRKLNPKGELDIESAWADVTMLTIKVNSPDDANEIKKRILEKIDEKHKNFIDIWNFNPIQVQVLFNAWEALLDKLR